MTDHMITAVVSVLIAIVGVAAIAVLVSRNAQTGGVLTSGAGAFSDALCTALSPVTGGSNSLVNGLLPNSGSFNFGGCSAHVTSSITFGG